MILIAVAAVVAIEFGVVFADDGVPTSGVAKNPPGAGDVDIERSRVYAFVGKTGLGHEHAVIGRLKSGSIHLGATQNAGQLEFDLTSFLADTKVARRYVGLTGETNSSTQEQVTANMLGQYVLDTQQFPTATFVIDSAQPLRRDNPNGPRRFQLDGQFTLHGTSRPLRLIARRARERTNPPSWRFKMLQTDYNITPFTKALGAVGVTDELKIYGDILIVANGN